MFDFFVDTALEASGVDLSERKEKKRREKEEKKERWCIVPAWIKSLIYVFGGLSVLISLFTLISGGCAVSTVILNILTIALTLLVIFFMWSGSYYLKEKDRDTAKTMEILGIVLGCIDLILIYAVL